MKKNSEIICSDRVSSRSDSSGNTSRGFSRTALSLALITAFSSYALSNMAVAAECSGGAAPAGAELVANTDFRTWSSDYALITDDNYPGDNSRSVQTGAFNLRGENSFQAPYEDGVEWQYSNGNGLGDLPVVVSNTFDLSGIDSDVLVTLYVSNVLRVPDNATPPSVRLEALGYVSDTVTAPIEPVGDPDIWSEVSLLIPQADLTDSVTISLIDMVPNNEFYGDDLAVSTMSVKSCGEPVPVDDGVISGTVKLDGDGIGGVTVTLTDTSDNSFEEITTTEANGTYSFSGLADSTTYVVTVSGDPISSVNETLFSSEPDVVDGGQSPAATNFIFTSDIAGFELGSSPNALAGNAYDYGTPDIDTVSSATFTVNNTATGTATLDIGTLAITGSPLYAVTDDNCSGVSVAAGGSCTFNVTYSPVEVPTVANEAEVTIPTQLGDSTLALTGLAQEEVSPSVEVEDGESGTSGTEYSLPFDGVQVGSVPPVDSVRVTNTGNADLLITDVAVTDGVFTHVPGTTAISNVCQLDTPIAPTEFCNLAFMMETSAVGSYTGEATVTTNAVPSTFTVNLSGVVGDKDSDGDGLLDLEEAAIGTNPNLKDTDGDGLDDKQEARDLPTDPLVSDTDGDGENDGDEVGDNVDAPLDTDGDTIIDAVEPSNVDTDRDGEFNENDTDDDGDNIPTSDEALNNSGDIKDQDGDSIPDYLESNLLNTDGDGLNNHLDPNDDNEGAVTGPSGEVGDDYFRPVDTDGDNIPDYLDADNSDTNDSDGDGKTDSAECPDGFPKCEVIEVNDADGNLRYQIPVYMTEEENVEPDAVVTPSAPEPTVETGVDGGVGGGAAGGALMSLMGLGFALRRRKFQGKSAVVAALATSALLVSSPQSAEADQGQWYVGAGAGISKVKPETEGTVYSIDDSISQGFKGIIGYDLTDEISIEGFYSDLGEGKLKPTGEIEYKVGGIGAVYNPVLDKETGISGILKLGVAGIDNDGNVPYRKVEDTQVFAGVGLEKAFSAGVSLRAEYEYFDKDVRFGSLNLIKRFGEESEPAAPVVVAKAPMDSDGDTVIDDRDECPGTPAGTEVDVRGCTFVADKVVDSDGDGITDARDQCMGTPEGTRVDDTGCPVVKKLTGVLEGVNFDTDSSNLTGEARLILDHLAVKLNQYTDVEVLLVGHTDDQASAAYNKRLSFDRAKAVASYLVSRGVSAKRMRFIGMGEAQPRASNGTAEGRARNRRVELIAK